MALTWLRQLLKQWSRRGSRPIRKQSPRGRWSPSLEPLSERILPAVKATFLPDSGLLTVIGDSQNNTIVINRDAAGSILVNGGAVEILGGKATVANTTLIQVFGQDGNDSITLDEANGMLPAANLFGGNGNDTLTGGSGNDMLFGQAGNDILLGKGGDDSLFGGDGNDVLTGGVGNDQVFGQGGNDLMIWNPGEGSDLNEGGDGVDTVEVNGGNGAETFTVTANGSRVRFDRTTPAPFFVDIGTTENLVVNMNGGDDSFTAGNGLATLINITVDGGAGNDTIIGGDGNDRLAGGDGNDLLIGGRGNDTMTGGNGDDTFVWNPGDASDTIEGQGGNDTLQFNGANVAEKFDLSANGTRLRLTRDVGTVTMDAAGIEQVNLVALGGADTINVGDLSRTEVTGVNIDLAATRGSGTGDGAADSVTVFGTARADAIQVTGSGTSYTVAGLSATVTVQGSEGASDRLTVQALGGNDTITAAGLPATVTLLTVDGGTGNDTITGSAGDDMLIGGDGNDLVIGGRGNDTALLGTGDDTFVWNPGDGSDIVEGQGGRDTLQFNGANIDEHMDLSANGTRLRFARDVGSVVMDVNGIEVVNIAALGGADTITVGDLSGTGVTNVNIDLAGTLGTGDTAADTVIVNGTAAADNIMISGSGHTATVSGLPATVRITNTDGTTDNLHVFGLGGNDTINASRLSAGVIGLTLDGGDGDDTLIGSAGDDLVIGGRGNDTALLGAGDDTFVWNPGDASDIVEGQGGNDTLQFNGANVAEKIDLTANGTRLRLTRDVGTVTMDVHGVEQVNVVALGGADTINVGDLSGTGVTDVNIDLASSPGSDFGDGAADSVTVFGTAGNDVIIVTGTAGSADVQGLSAHVHIVGAEPSNDLLTISALGGDDVVTAAVLSATAIGLVEDGGDGADVLIGGAGNDTLQGGAGDDILNGGPGQDVLDGGTGSNVVIQ
jgi:Ca2+-binding RTX toxin-like protein